MPSELLPSAQEIRGRQAASSCKASRETRRGCDSPFGAEPSRLAVAKPAGGWDLHNARLQRRSCPIPSLSPKPSAAHGAPRAGHRTWERFPRPRTRAPSLFLLTGTSYRAGHAGEQAGVTTSSLAH